MNYCILTQGVSDLIYNNNCCSMRYWLIISQSDFANFSFEQGFKIFCFFFLSLFNFKANSFNVRLLIRCLKYGEITL